MRHLFQHEELFQHEAAVFSMRQLFQRASLKKSGCGMGKDPRAVLVGRSWRLVSLSQLAAASGMRGQDGEIGFFGVLAAQRLHLPLQFSWRRTPWLTHEHCIHRCRNLGSLNGLDRLGAAFPRQYGCGQVLLRRHEHTQIQSLIFNLSMWGMHSAKHRPPPSSAPRP